MAETIRLRVVFEERRMLSKSKKKEGLKRSWFLLKPQHNTISDVASHLQNTFRLHRTCPNGIILLMEGFVLPSFESTRILKDKDVVCVRRKGSILAYDKPAMLPSETRGQRSIELPKLLAIEGFQEENGGYETMSQEDNNDQLEDAVYVESKSDGKPISKKRKASKKLKSPSQKKIKLSTTENLAVIPEVHEEENESFQGSIHHESSLVKKNNGKSSNLSSQPNKSSKDNFNKQMNDKSGSASDETRFLQPQDEGGTKKLPSRSNRRKKAKRRWLRELKLEKEKFHTSPMLEKDGQQLPIKDNNSLVSDVHQQPDEESEEEDDIVPGLKKHGQHLPIKDNNCIVSDVHEQPDEESEEEDDVVPVEIRPGHIRFEPRRKDQTVPQNQFPVETFQWNGITSKKKGQKWGKERNSFRKQDDYEHSSQEYPTVQNAEKKHALNERNSFRKQDDYEHSSQECPTVQNAEKKHALNAADFDKLTPYTSLPKEGDVIAYRLIELSSSWTPELSSFRVGKISQYDAKSNRIWLEPVLEYPFDFEKKIDEDTSSLQSDPSPYREDGSLEIDYVSLADVRMVKHGLATVVVSSDDLVNPTKANNGSTDGSCIPEREGHIRTKENGEVNVWDEINEALKAKKAKLSQEDGWNKEQSSGTRSWSNRALRCSALGPTMAFLRSKNGL